MLLLLLISNFLLLIFTVDAWEAIRDMVEAGPSGKKGVSSILLSAPGFDDDFALWAGPVFAMLEAGVSAIQAEEMIGVVCFHPKCKWSNPLLYIEHKSLLFLSHCKYFRCSS